MYCIHALRKIPHFRHHERKDGTGTPPDPTGHTSSANIAASPPLRLFLLVPARCPCLRPRLKDTDTSIQRALWTEGTDTSARKQRAVALSTSAPTTSATTWTGIKIRKNIVNTEMNERKDETRPEREEEKEKEPKDSLNKDKKQGEH